MKTNITIFYTSFVVYGPQNRHIGQLFSIVYGQEIALGFWAATSTSTKGRGRGGTGVAACGLCCRWHWRCEFNLPRLRIFSIFVLENICKCQLNSLLLLLLLFVVISVVVFSTLVVSVFCVVVTALLVFQLFHLSSWWLHLPSIFSSFSSSLSLSRSFVGSFFGKFVYWQQQREQQQEQEQQQQQHRQWQPPLTKTRTVDQLPSGHETCAPIFIIIFIVVAVVALLVLLWDLP